MSDDPGDLTGIERIVADAAAAIVADAVRAGQITPSMAGGLRLGPYLDPRWAWQEIATAEQSGVRYARVGCNHLEVTPVESVTGEVVAGLCLTCDTQLPPPRRAA